MQRAITTRCADCKRALLKPALQLTTRTGTLSFGRVCARRYIVRPTRTSFKVLDRRVVQREGDPRQMALELVA